MIFKKVAVFLRLALQIQNFLNFIVLAVYVMEGTSYKQSYAINQKKCYTCFDLEYRHRKIFAVYLMAEKTYKCQVAGTELG